MQEQYTPNLGHPPHENARRDAVHVAVAPLVADGVLIPGQWVRLTKEGKAIPSDGQQGVGVVDPFRADLVRFGESFWVCLKPGTVTGLRHLWSHPAFAPKPPGVES